MEFTSRSYVPAAGKDWLLPLYDPVQWLLGGDAARRELIERAAIQPAQRMLEIGCGTGSLVVQLKQMHPDADVVGLDPDPRGLARARRKAARAGVDIAFDECFADALPYPDASFDRVFSSFMFHHLERAVKEKTLREVRRVLKASGSLHLLDFGGPTARDRGLIARLLHASEPLADNFENRIPKMMEEAGLARPHEVSHRGTLFGRIAYYQAGASAAPGPSGIS
ncbi:MAG TPA: methyltransferase domain-containing protein [Myxococcota bacterium]|nr:methyltransferase domain-containing protein [Myxococcota bacterium]